MALSTLGLVLASASKQIVTARPLSGTSSQSPKVPSRDRQLKTPVSAMTHRPRLVSESAFLIPSVIHSPSVGSAILSRFRGCTSSRLVWPLGLTYFIGWPSRLGTGREGFHWKLTRCPV